MNISKGMFFIQIFALISLSCLFFAQNASAIVVVTTIPVGNNPHSIAYDSAKGGDVCSKR